MILSNKSVLIVFLAFLSGVFCISLPVCAEEYPIVIEAEISVVLSAERDGVLTFLNVDVGDWVEKDEVIGEVYHKELMLQKEQSVSRIEYMKVQLENLTKLNEKGLVPDEELAKVQMEYQVNQKEIDIYEAMIQRSRIKAPFPGLVVERKTEPYEWVRNGQPVVEIYGANKLRAVADIPAEVAFRLNEGQKVNIFFPDLNKETEAVLSVFSPRVDVRSNTVKVYWKVTPRIGKQRLVPGMKGIVKFGSQ